METVTRSDLGGGYAWRPCPCESGCQMGDLMVGPKVLLMEVTIEQAKRKVSHLRGARCELCGETYGDDDQRAEMYDPLRPELPSLIVHAECGLARGFEVA